MKDSYSQFGEDKIVAKLFADKNFGEGNLLEIGAWDPECFSNSRLLIEQGWKAVLVEPSPIPLSRLVTHYGGEESKVTVIQAAVTIEDLPVHRFKLSDDSVSSDRAENLHKWSSVAKYLGWCWCATITLEDIWNQFGGFDFVSIDTEGNSVDIAMKYLARTQPLVMMVEHDDRVVELQAFAQKWGYKTVHTNGTNVILSKI